MTPQFYIYLGIALLLITAGRIVMVDKSKSVDWALIVAFIRLEFPAHQRDAAQKLAAGLAEIVGLKIKQLRPEHTLEEIASWADPRVSAAQLTNIFEAAYRVRCDADTTFRTLVEKVTERENSAKIKAGPSDFARP